MLTMRLNLLMFASLKCASNISVTKRVDIIFYVFKRKSSMALADEKPPIGAILVNVPNKRSDAAVQDSYQDGPPLYAESQFMETCACQTTVNKNSSAKSVQLSKSSSNESVVVESYGNLSNETKFAETIDVDSLQKHSSLPINREHNVNREIGKVKKSVLPKNLLDSVTNLIRQQKTKHADTKCKSDNITPDRLRTPSSVDDNKCFETEHHVHTEDQPETGSDRKELIEIDNKLLLINDNTEQTDKCSVDFEHTLKCVSNESSDHKDSSTISDNFVESETEKDLLFPDLIDETLPTTLSDEDVFDISTLFTGELDRRRKSERKRAGKWSKTKEKKKKQSKGGKDVEETDEGKVKKNLPPNFFVSIQITNKKIHEALHMVQVEVLSGNPLLSSAMVKLDKLHLTLMVLRIDTEEEMASQGGDAAVLITSSESSHFLPTRLKKNILDQTRSKKALDTTMDNLLSTYSNKTLAFDLCGLGNFRNEIVFAMIKDERKAEEVKQIASVVENSFFTQDLVSTEDRGFKPHVTVMKLSKGKSLRKKGIKKIDSSLYEKYQSAEFGEEQVTRLQLCSMMKTGPTGYYLVEHEAYFPPGTVSVDDSGFEESSFTDKEGSTEILSTHCDNCCSDNVDKSLDSLLELENTMESGVTKYTSKVT